MKWFFPGLIYLTGTQGSFLVKRPKKKGISLDFKFIDFFFESFKKKKRIFKLSNNFLTLNTKVFVRWEFTRKEILGISALNSSLLSNLSIQILNEIGKYGFLGIFQHQLAKKLNLKSSYIHHHLITLTNLKLVKKTSCLNQKNSKISNPILLIANYFNTIGIIKEKKNFSFKILSKQNELRYFKKLVDTIVRQERDIGQKNLKYGILFQTENFKKKDKRKIHRVWQKLRERLIKSNVLFEKRLEKKGQVNNLKVFRKIFLDFKKKGNFTISFVLRIFPPNDYEIKFLFYTSPLVQIQKTIQTNSLMGVNFPFLVDNLRGQVNYKTIHSIIKNLESFRGLIRKFKQIGRQRILNFRVDFLEKSKLNKIENKGRKSQNKETDQVTTRRLLLLSWLDSHVLVLKELGKKFALFEKRGLARVDSKVIRRILSDLIKHGHLKILKIQIQLNFWKTKEIEFVTKKDFNSFHVKKITEYMVPKKENKKKKNPQPGRRKIKKKRHLSLFLSPVAFLRRKYHPDSPKIGIFDCFFFWKKKTNCGNLDWKMWKTFLFYPKKTNPFLRSRFFISANGQEKTSLWKNQKKSLVYRIKKEKKNETIPRISQFNFFFDRNPIFPQKLEKNWVKKSLSKRAESLDLFSPARRFASSFFLSKLTNYLHLNTGLSLFLKQTFLSSYTPFPFGKTFFFFKKKKKVPKTVSSFYFRKKTTNLLPFLDDSIFKTVSLDKWDCESDVKLFQFHLFEDPINYKFSKTFFTNRSKPLFRRLKGIVTLGNTKRVKLYAKKCFRFSWSPFLTSKGYNLLMMTKRSLEFPSNFFCFDTEKVSTFCHLQTWKKKKKTKVTTKESTVENFTTWTSFSRTIFIFSYNLPKTIMLFEKVFFFYDMSIKLEKPFLFFWETFLFFFFQFNFRNSPSRLSLFFFKNLVKLIQYFPGYELRKIYQRDGNFFRFLAELKKSLLFKNLEEGKSIFYPFLLKCKFNKIPNFDKVEKKRAEKFANRVEIRIQKKNIFYIKTNKLLNKSSKKIFIGKKGIVQKKKTKKQKNGKKALNNFFLFALKFLNSNLKEKKPFSRIQKACLVIFSMQFFSKNLPFETVFFLRQNFSITISEFIDKSSEKEIHESRFLKLVLLTKILNSPGKERSCIAIFLKISPFCFMIFDRVNNLLLMEKKIYLERYFIKSWKFSISKLKTLALTILTKKIKNQRATELTFPYFYGEKKKIVFIDIDFYRYRFL